jgi:hypothetical protein
MFIQKLTPTGLSALYLPSDIQRENMLAKSLTSNHSKSFLLKSFLDGKEKKEVGDFARLTLK